MLEFRYPINIAYIILAIAAVVLFILAFRKKEKIISMLHLDVKIQLKALRTALLGIGLGLFVFSLMGPQIFAGYREVSRYGLDIYVLMDVSKSMLVSDIQPDRLTIATRIVETLLDNLEGDRIGFIPFASDAYIQMPLTDDYRLAGMFLDVMDTDMIGGGGSNIAAAIRLAYDSFERASGADRVILLLSDGEEHDRASLEGINRINDDRLRVFTVGIGTERGGLVPIYNDAGDTIIDYFRDKSGNPVASRLDAELMKALAQHGNGAYYHATVQGTEISYLLRDLSALKRDSLDVLQIRRFTPLYQYFLAPGIFLFTLAWLLPDKLTRSSTETQVLN